jgi:hypothetical protein
MERQDRVRVDEERDSAAAKRFVQSVGEIAEATSTKDIVTVQHILHELEPVVLSGGLRASRHESPVGTERELRSDDERGIDSRLPTKCANSLNARIVAWLYSREPDCAGALEEPSHRLFGLLLPKRESERGGIPTETHSRWRGLRPDWHPVLAKQPCKVLSPSWEGELVRPAPRTIERGSENYGIGKRHQVVGVAIEEDDDALS